VAATVHAGEAVIPAEQAEEHRPLIEEIIETGRPISLEKLQAAVVQVERRLRDVEETRKPSLEAVTAATAVSEPVEGPTTDQPMLRYQYGTASVPGLPGQAVPAVGHVEEAIIPPDLAKENRPAIERLLTTRQPLPTEDLQAAVKELHQEVEEIKQGVAPLVGAVQSASPTDAAVESYQRGTLSVPGFPGQAVSVEAHAQEAIIPREGAQANRPLIDELIRFGRSFSLEKLQEAIAKHDQELRRIKEELLALAGDGAGEASDPAAEARQYQQLRERLARDEGWLTQVLREFARLNQARDLRLLPVAAGTVNF
jgi:hypothetical protein